MKMYNNFIIYSNYNNLFIVYVILYTFLKAYLM